MTLRPVSVLAVALGVVASGCLGFGTMNHAYPVDPETGEPNRAELDRWGQMNCIAEARAGEPDARCPVEPTGVAHPATGILVLDAFYIGAVGPAQPLFLAEAAVSWDPTDPSSQAPYQVAFDALRGGNTARASGGLLPDIILPGPGGFVAVLGWWDNHDGDADLELRGSRAFDEEGRPIWPPDNEFAPLGVERPLGFVEPGSRPTAHSPLRPGAHEPDFAFEYVLSHHIYASEYAVDSYGAGRAGAIVFLDGSLVQTFTTAVVSNATSTPNIGGLLPFHPGSSARVDIDVYAAIAPGPVAALYGASAAPVANGRGSPSLGWCPDGCEAEAVPATGTSADAFSGAAARSAWGRYPQEWRDGSGSTNAGRREAYLAEYTPWIDLLPKTKIVHQGRNSLVGHTVPLIGGERDGVPTMAPGVLTLELFVGLHRDLDGDGFVGRAARDDPYEGGRRPHPDDYVASEGEFFGLRPVTPSEDGGRVVMLGMTATLVPHTVWGEGVFRSSSYHVQRAIMGYEADPERCMALLALPDCADPDRMFLRGTEPITLLLQELDGFPGRYGSDESVAMLNGSPGFTVCVEALLLQWTTPDGDAREEWVRDCDEIARYGG
ncbi:MAG TPA: hypothetical protein VM889_08885 [Candidatus Thermoplasmatota archaeon]|nr:hypothetical protein [Candidatus Thermoplasmatota archaeon]